MDKQKLLMFLVVMLVAVAAIPVNAYLLVYEPFDYDAEELTGQGGALGTVGTWTSNAQNDPAGWQVHQEGALSGALLYDGTTAVLFDGTVDNLPTTGGYTGHGSAGYKLNADIALDPSVTETFKSGSTTWISYVSVASFDRNYEMPNLMLATDPFPTPSRGENHPGSGFGSGGGPNRDNRASIYPMFYTAGQYNNVQGPIPGNSYASNADTYVDDTGAFSVSVDAANIVVMKIEWDADGGKDIVTVARFLEGEEISETAFDAMVVAMPNISSANWDEANKPDIDQSQLDTITMAGIKYFVDEIRIGTEFIDAQGFGEPLMAPSPANKATVPPGDVVLSWTNLEQQPDDANDLFVEVLFGTDPNKTDGDMAPLALDPASGLDVTTVTVEGLTDGTYYWRVNTTFGTDPCVIEGPLWEFYVTSDLAPSVDIVTAEYAGSDIMTWSGQAVDLIADVDDDGKSELTYAWSAQVPQGIAVEFDPGTDTSAASVTATKVAYLSPYVANSSFEDPALDDKTTTNTNNVASWSTQWSAVGSGTWANDNSPNGGAWDPNDTGDFDGALPDGENVGYVDTDAGYEHCLYQQVSAVVVASTQYDLSVKVGNPSDYNGGATNDYRLELLVNGWVVASTAGASPADDQSWITAEVSYTGADPNVGQPIAIRLISTAATASRLCFDDVVLSIDGQPGEMIYGPSGATVTITVAVNDQANPTPATDSIEIDVYDDACSMARIGQGMAEARTGDYDGDCDTDLDDLAILAGKWLNDLRLAAPQHK